MAGPAQTRPEMTYEDVALPGEAAGEIGVGRR